MGIRLPRRQHHEYHFGNASRDLGRYAPVCADDAPHSREREDAAFDKTLGKRKPNAWGIYDMHDNMHGFCADWFGEDYYATSPQEDPLAEPAAVMLTWKA